MTSKVSIGGLPRHVADPDPSIYWREDYVVLDFETTTGHKGSPLAQSNRIVLACWSEPNVGPEDASSTYGTPARRDDKAVYERRMRFIRGGEFDMGELVKAINAASFIVAHNAKFELGWLRRCGVDLRTVVVYDTMLGEYVLGGNRYNMVQMSLKNTLKRYGLEGKMDVVSEMIAAGAPTDEIPEEWLLKYCVRDVNGCEEIFLRQREKLRDRKLIHLLYQRCLVTPALADIEVNGMHLDEKAVDAEIADLEQEYAKKTAALQEFCDGVPPTSTPQKRDYVYDVLKFDVPLDYRGRPMLTNSGTKSVAADVMDALRPKTSKQREFLRLHKEWAAMHSDVTKYLRKMKHCCEVDDGFLQAVFNQAATRTHRLSSSGFIHKIQFQNLNRKFKPLFSSRHPGWFMGEMDGAQLEFRTATHQGRDPQALADIVNGVDIHRYSASIIWDIQMDEVAPHQRQNAKEHTFKPLYGGKSGTPEQQRYYAAFAEKYNHIATTQRRWTIKVLEEKKLRTEYGLIFYWPDCKMKPSGYITHTNNIYNYPVQGLATAEIIPLGLVCAWHRMKDWQSFLVNTVHDSLVSELHPDEVEAWHELAQRCLIDDCYMLLRKLYGIDFTVPLGAGVMVGTHWGSKEAKKGEVVYEARPELYEEAARRDGML